MLDSFDLVGGLLQPLISFPSPPGWSAYTELLERTLNFLAIHLHSAGLAVIVFTIIIKTLLLPLTVKAMYCLPSTMYVIGVPMGGAGKGAKPISSPVSLS